MEALSRGDLAWWAGRRGEARRAWREALAVAVAGERARDRAVEAAARVRLLQVSGTFGPFIHERKLRDAEAGCLTAEDPALAEPWCAVARADDDLFLPAFTGADPTKVPARLARSPLTGPAAARVGVATGVGPEAVGLDTMPASALDGFARGYLESGLARPPDPGTWSLSFGIGGAPGAGFGAVVRYVDPDVGWKAHRLEVQAGANTLGGGSVSASLATASLATRLRPSVQAQASGWREVGYRWLDVVERYEDTGGRLGLGLGVSGNRWSARGGAVVRSDDLGAGAAVVVGPSAGFGVGTRQAWAGMTAEAGFGAYTHLVVSGEVRAFPTLLGGTLAMRGLVQVVPTPESPFYRLPSAGGSALLRGAPAGRWRDDTLVAAQVEYRHPVFGPLHAAAFADGAAVDGLHWTAGGGLRLVLPPADTNVTRVDVGVGPGTWGVVVAWGHAF